MESSQKASWFRSLAEYRLRKPVQQFALITLITWFGGPTPAAAQNQDTGNLPPGPPIVYVSNGGGGITEINTANNSVIATAPFPNNANGVVVTPDGRRMYATNRDVGQVTVFSTTTNVPLTVIPVGNGSDNLGLAISPDGSLVYVANQFSGTVTVIATATNTVTKIIPTGLEPIWITFSADGSRAYVSNQVSGTISVIATASGSVINNIGGFSCPFQSAITRDGSKLLVSSQCDNSLKVVNLATNAIVNVIPTGPNPRGIALTPDGTRAYVANWFSNTVDVIDVVSLTNLNTPITVGFNPWGMAMTPNGKAYTANFGDNTISVIDTSTNAVTATLPARGNPEDVTVSTKARPGILNYSLQAFDPPGSVDTVPRDVNSLGQNVGSFQDGAGVVHGYLRQANGSFVTIDPPGSTLTVAAGINDAGTIVGQWQASGGAFHGFVRSPSGVYTTVDFPGATDTGIAGINKKGTLAGVYDLGDVSTNIGFVDAAGVFTSFEDPAAVPMETAAADINLMNFVSGSYDDAVTTHGFIRDLKGQFHNFDFPVADFTIGARINDMGQVVGQYATNFPQHGYILNGAMALTGPPLPCQLFSFDYPDSQASALRGINNLGQVAGFYRLHGDPARHGFLATPMASQDQNQDSQCSGTAGLSPKHGGNFASFDFPGATNTQATGIAPSGKIVGRYVSADGNQHGFALQKGSFSSIDVPGANSTDVTWINARGDIVGSYSDSAGGHAFVLSKGAFKSIDFPGANLSGFGISNTGDVLGVQFFGGDFLHGHGYLFSRGTFTFIDVPGAVGTFPTMVLDPKRIVGSYFDNNSMFHGFKLINGQFSTIDFPNSTFTWVTGMNPEGDIVGFYFSQDGNQHGFVLSSGKFLSIDVPVPGASFTEGNGIDAGGNVVGRYNGSDGKTHGYFLRCVTCSDPRSETGRLN
jgi:YVTN family beta-propeller protein